MLKFFVTRSRINLFTKFNPSLKFHFKIHYLLRWPPPMYRQKIKNIFMTSCSWIAYQVLVTGEEAI